MYWHILDVRTGCWAIIILILYVMPVRSVKDYWLTYLIYWKELQEQTRRSRLVKVKKNFKTQKIIQASKYRRPPTNGPPTNRPPTNRPPTNGPPTNGPPIEILLYICWVVDIKFHTCSLTTTTYGFFHLFLLPRFYQYSSWKSPEVVYVRTL